MKMIEHNHFICHLILGTFTEYPNKKTSPQATTIARGEADKHTQFKSYYLEMYSYCK